MSVAIRAYIGLGSNLDNPRAQLDRAVAALEQIPACRLLRVSSYYRSLPMGPQDQPHYLNAVALLETSLQPEALLEALQVLELQQGRVRQQHWGPRTLDLDLLLYADHVIDSERLQVPHTGLFQRNFVLYPLHEIEPGLVFPGKEVLEEIITGCSAEGLERLDNQ